MITTIGQVGGQTGKFCYLSLCMYFSVNNVLYGVGQAGINEAFPEDSRENPVNFIPNNQYGMHRHAAVTPQLQLIDFS